MSNSLLSLENLGKTYETGSFSVEVLKGLTFDIQQGEFIALMGPSGSGKSTLMNILGCLDIPTVGNYLLGGKNVSLANDEELADIRNEKIGFIFQTFNLLAKYTALDNVALPLIYAGKDKAQRTEQASAVLRKVGQIGRAHV